MASTYLCLLLWKSGLITIFTLLVVLFPCENIFFFVSIKYSRDTRTSMFTCCYSIVLLLILQAYRWYMY
jgi:hypothetical protein